MNYKNVIFTISVPAGNHCSKGGTNTCEHFDSHGFGTGCGLGLGRPGEDDNGWEVKPQRCSQLNESKVSEEEEEVSSAEPQIAGGKIFHSNDKSSLEGLEMGVEFATGGGLYSKGIHKSTKLTHKYMLIVEDTDKDEVEHEYI